MKDFDIIRAERINPDRSVKVGGQTLKFKPGIPAEMFAEWLDGRPVNEKAALVEADKFVLACLEPGQEEKWREARSPDLEHPLSIQDIRDVIEHILEVVVNRPTVRPPDSSSTSAASGTTSTESSPSPVEAG